METQYRVNGMKCGGCVANVEQALKAVAGVVGVRVDLAQGLVRVRGEANAQAVIVALNQAGYPTAKID